MRLFYILHTRSQFLIPCDRVISYEFDRSGSIELMRISGKTETSLDCKTKLASGRAWGCVVLQHYAKTLLCTALPAPLGTTPFGFYLPGDNNSELFTLPESKRFYLLITFSMATHNLPRVLSIPEIMLTGKLITIYFPVRNLTLSMLKFYRIYRICLSFDGRPSNSLFVQFGHCL